MKDLIQLNKMQKQAAKRELDNKLLFLQRVPCIETRIEQDRLIVNHLLCDKELKI